MANSFLLTDKEAVMRNLKKIEEENSSGWCPTVDIDVRFISFGNLGDVLIGTGRIVTAGRRIFHMESSLVDKATSKLVATSTSTYLNMLDKSGNQKE